MGFDEKLADTNKRLKAANIRITIEKRGDSLGLRGVLPPKPGSSKLISFQQRVPLSAKATPAGLQHAEQKAKLMSAQLDLGKFDWAEWITAPEPEIQGELVGDWINKYEEEHWAKTPKNQKTLFTWDKDYSLVFRKLPKEQVLSVDILINYIKTTEPNSRSRKRACDYCFVLAEFADLEGKEKIKEFAGNYSSSAVNPRNLPSDVEIVSFRDSIKNPAWRWLVGIMATYGLRNHEVFRLDIRDFPVVRVTEGKTGDRFVYPLYPEWAQMWNLQDMVLPNISTEHSNSKIGTKIGKWFNVNNAPFAPYALRNAYARRCFEFGLSPDWAAGLMGHSPQVHTSVYRAWIDEETYMRAYKAIINREGRPQPPS